MPRSRFLTEAVSALARKYTRQVVVDEANELPKQEDG
jgi:hypothetical protein